MRDFVPVRKLLVRDERSLFFQSSCFCVTPERSEVLSPLPARERMKVRVRIQRPARFRIPPEDRREITLDLLHAPLSGNLGSDFSQSKTFWPQSREALSMLCRPTGSLPGGSFRCRQRQTSAARAHFMACVNCGLE
jgi:hypothetical protein